VRSVTSRTCYTSERGSCVRCRV